YIDMFSGASGDMLLGALVDAGVSLNKIKKEISKLPIDFKISAMKEKDVIVGTSVFVESMDKKERTLDDVISLLEESDLKEEVKEKAKKVFMKIGDVEARLHGEKNVHFHELGMVDSIVDVVGTIYAFNELGIEKIYSSPFILGKGFANSLHGKIPVPAPATLELLKGMPAKFTETEAEITTPTAVGLLSILVDKFSCPSMVIEKIGYGMGKKKLGHPNFLRLVVGEEKEKTYVVEANIDDANPELYPFIIEKLIKSNALDAFFTPIHMKKGRIGTLLHVLVEEKNLEKIKDVIFQETTTFGIRFYNVDREILERRIENVETCYGKIPVKIGVRKGSIITISPEYEECKKKALQKKVPIKKVYEEARLSAHKKFLEKEKEKS
ncbi:MAG: nickel pincer cofactor biosynthesis protein LarC, partial [Thermoplasmata archaeon]